MTSPRTNGLTDPEGYLVGFSFSTAAVTGLVAVLASQVELALRSGGDFSFWGFAIMFSVISAVLYGVICLVAGLGARSVSHIRRLPLRRRTYAAAASMAAALILVTIAFAVIGGSAFWLTTAACVGAIVLCAATTGFGEPLSETKAERRRREGKIQL